MQLLLGYFGRILVYYLLEVSENGAYVTIKRTFIRPALHTFI